MRILHLTTGISTQSAVYRLHKAYLKSGIDSYVYSGLNSLKEERIFSNDNDLELKIKARLERQLFKFYPNRQKTPWNLGFYNNVSKKKILALKPDIIHLHWINQFVSIKQIANFGIPVVWTLHDSWAFTGGCHIPFQCEKFKSECQACPQLNSKRSYDLSKIIFDLKRKSWKKGAITIIGPSKWITECARSSKLLSEFPIINIPNCIDTDFYSKKDKILSRKKLGIPIHKKIILFGANNATGDKNKGYDLLEKAYNMIKQSKFGNEIELVVFGTRIKDYSDETKIRQLGYILDSKIFPFLYSAADVVINASRSENFSNVILESLSCGIPVVAFNIGGNSDLIKSNINGEIVKAFDVNELTKAILDVLNSENIDSNIISKSIVEFSEKEISNRHNVLYHQLLL